MTIVQSQFGVTFVAKEESFGVELSGAFAGTSSKTIMRINNTASFEQADDYWNERKYVVIGLTGDNAGVARLVTDWDKAAAQLTFDAFPTTMDSADTFALKKVVLAEIPTPDVGQELLERNNQRDTLSDEGNVPGRYNPKTSLIVEWRGSGTAAGFNFADFSPLLVAAGLNESTASANKVIYTPVTGGAGNQGSVTIDHYSKDGVHYKFLGCKTTLSLETEGGELPKATFGVEAYDSSENTAAAPTLPDNAWNEVLPKPVLGVTFQLSGAGEKISSFGLNLDSALTRFGSQASTSGTTEIVITKRPTMVTFNPEADDAAKIGVWQKGTTRTVSWALGAAGNKTTIAAPAVQFQTVTEVDDDGVKRFDIEGKCILSSGNDEISITME